MMYPGEEVGLLSFDALIQTAREIPWVGMI